MGITIQAINTRNQFKGRIQAIIMDKVVSEVIVETATGVITAIITTRSLQDLGLEVGSEVLTLVKSTEVSIAKLTSEK